MKKISFIITLIGLSILLYSRFALLDKSARFVWDESDDLVRMAEMVRRNPITLVGPMNANKTHIQSSLTYYMVMPGAIMTKFHPIGPVYMTAVYGIMTVLMLAFICSRYFKWKFSHALIFFTVIFPLVQTSRWAWNPHFIPFWQTLGLLLFFRIQKNTNIFSWFLVGFLLTLPFHNHWYAIFAAIGFGIMMTIYLIKDKKLKVLSLYTLGSFSAIFPLLIFDILHPPGLFITRALFFSPLSIQNGGFDLTHVPMKILQFPIQFLEYFFQSNAIAVAFLIILLAYVASVIKNKKVDLIKKLILIPIATQILGLTLIAGAVFDYYYLGAVIPILIFLAIPDKEYYLDKFRLILLGAIFIFSILPSWGEVHKDTWMTNIGRKMKIYEIIKANLPADKKCNVFVPASESGDAVGKIYRDLLIARDDIWLLPDYDYGAYKCLFVVSTSKLSVIQKDVAYELDRIRDKKPVKKWKVADTQWTVYYFKL